uniref:Uncharacterized protein n=1 Tax=Lotharella globosa TaxID=91324 RepID=A0A7S3YTF7_9EUKA
MISSSRKHHPNTKSNRLPHKSNRLPHKSKGYYSHGANSNASDPQHPALLTKKSSSIMPSRRGPGTRPSLKRKPVQDADLQIPEIKHVAHQMNILARLQKLHLTCLNKHSEAHAELMEMRSLLNQICLNHINKGSRFVSRSAMRQQVRRMLKERSGVVSRVPEINMNWSQLLQTADDVRKKRKKIKTLDKQLSNERIKLEGALKRLDSKLRQLNDLLRNLKTQESKFKDDQVEMKRDIEKLSNEYVNLVRDCGFVEKTAHRRLNDVLHKVGSCPVENFPKYLRPVAAAYKKNQESKTMLAQIEKDQAEIEKQRESLARCRSEAEKLPKVLTPSTLQGQLETVETFELGDRVSIPSPAGSSSSSSHVQGSIVAFPRNTTITVQLDRQEEDEEEGGGGGCAPSNSNPLGSGRTVDVKAGLVWFDWADEFPFPASVAESQETTPPPGEAAE